MSLGALSFHTTLMNRYIDGMRAGEPGAADELVRRAQGRFRRLSQCMYRSFPNITQVAEADDVSQMGWIRLLATLKRVRPENTSRFFLLAAVMIRRVLLDLARKAKSLAYQTRSLDAARGAEGSSDGGAGAEPLARSAADFELWELFHVAVGKLSPNPQKVMMLVFYDGRSHAQVADILGKDVRTVGRYWKQACVEIRALVGGWALPPD